MMSEIIIDDQRFVIKHHKFTDTGEKVVIVEIWLRDKRYATPEFTIQITDGRVDDLIKALQSGKKMAITDW